VVPEKTGCWNPSPPFSRDYTTKNSPYITASSRNFFFTCMSPTVQFPALCSVSLNLRIYLFVRWMRQSLNVAVMELVGKSACVGLPRSSWKPSGALATLQLDPSHGIFCRVGPHAAPPLRAGCSTCLRLCLVPGPHRVSHSLHSSQSDARTQSTAVHATRQFHLFICS